jgi:hypothetical protein
MIGALRKLSLVGFASKVMSRVRFGFAAGWCFALLLGASDDINPEPRHSRAVAGSG